MVYNAQSDTLYISDTLGSQIVAVTPASKCAAGTNCTQTVVTSGGLLNGPIGMCSTPKGTLVTPQVCGTSPWHTSWRVTCVVPLASIHSALRCTACVRCRLGRCVFYSYADAYRNMLE
jgi:hypothetical protein